MSKKEYGFFTGIMKRIQVALNILIAPTWMGLWIDPYDGSLTIMTHNMMLEDLEKLLEELKEGRDE